MTTLTMTIPVRLGELREDHDKPRKAIAEAIGVSDTAVWQWDTGNKSPRIPSVVAYAALFNHRVVVTQHGHTICDLADALPRLAELRQAAGLTMRDLARRIHVVFNSICTLEHDAGPTSYLSTIERHLIGCGYEITLVPAGPAAPAVDVAPRRRGRPRVGDGTHKRCPDCTQTKPNAEYSLNRTRPDGRNPLCKPCQKVRRQDQDARRKAAGQQVAA